MEGVVLQNKVIYGPLRWSFKYLSVPGRCLLIVTVPSQNDLLVRKFLILKKITQVYFKGLVNIEIIFEINLSQSRKGGRLQMPK